LLLDPGDAVCIEDPGYPGAVFAFKAAGARIVPVPTDRIFSLPACTSQAMEGTILLYLLARIG
jgi:DNA-binding transcriptional MocR family regulator